MHSTIACVLWGGKAVHQTSKTVFWLCNFIVRFCHFQSPIPITIQLYAALYSGFSLHFPRPKFTNNRYSYRFIPIIHRSNNKSYMDVLNFILEKLWIGRYVS